ncbi:MAG: amidohydrolase [Pseudomonadota bacterium]
MNSIAIHVISAVLAVSLLASCRGKRKKPEEKPMDKPALCADAIFTNGKIFTVSASMPEAGAFSIKDGKFLKVGSTGDVLAHKCASTGMHDLEGRRVLPGLIDSHAHFTSLGLTDNILDLANAASAEEVAGIVKQAAGKFSRDQWIMGRGWDQNEWEEKKFPDRKILDAVESSRPVFLERVDGHAVWVNTKALELAGIDASTADERGGQIIRRSSGDPTGVLVDSAMIPVEKLIQPAGRAEKKAAIKRAVDKCLSAGLTMVHAAGVHGEIIELYRELIDENAFPFRIYAMISCPGEDCAELMAKGPVIGWKDRLWVRAVKLYSDGALGSRGAALLEPYSDEPDNSGQLAMTPESLEKAVMEVIDKGFQPGVHSIGDRSARILIDIYEKATAKHPGKDIRPRIEHAQVVTLEDIKRIGKLGVVAAMQPIHCTSDMKWAQDRLGPERSNYAYAWRKVLESGALLCSGTDFPVESHNPFPGLHAAVTRQASSGFPEGGWHPENAMTLEEAIESYTLSGAKASFNEKILGSIEEGKFADFVVLDKDIFTVPANEIHSISSFMTVVGGQIAYRK